mmetsp:Transcript_3138/g.7055  ORF Transcript_3138/g.7055 Transcript_3138/m.7055 type:complete len:143 (+) Transcript_3138:565-993(+)
MMLVYRVGDYPCYMETKDQRRRDLQEELQEQRQRRMATMKDYEDLKKCLNWNADHPEYVKNNNIAKKMLNWSLLKNRDFFKDVTEICIRFKVGVVHATGNNAMHLCGNMDEDALEWSEAEGIQADLDADIIEDDGEEDGGDF